MVTDDCVDTEAISLRCVKDSVVKWLPAFVGITGDDLCKHRAIVHSSQFLPTHQHCLPLFADSSLFFCILVARV